MHTNDQKMTLKIFIFDTVLERPKTNIHSHDHDPQTCLIFFFQKKNKQKLRNQFKKKTQKKQNFAEMSQMVTKIPHGTMF